VGRREEATGDSPPTSNLQRAAGDVNGPLRIPRKFPKKFELCLFSKRVGSVLGWPLTKPLESVAEYEASLRDEPH